MNENKNAVMVNEQLVKYDVGNFILNICDMVKMWPAELEEQGAVDGVIYEIRIKDSKELKSYKFNNKFPEDIYRLENFLKELSNKLKRGKNEYRV